MSKSFVILLKNDIIRFFIDIKRVFYSSYQGLQINDFILNFSSH